jgi:hypothetical protein
MKTETRSIYQIKVNDKTVAELAEVLMGRPSKLVGHAIIQNGDKDGAKFFDDYDDALTSFCNVYNLDRADVTRSSWWTNVLAVPESADEDIQSFYDHLVNIGFKIEHTGGGCTWWAKYFLDGTYIAITQDGHKEIHAEHLEDCGVLVGLYHGDDCEGEYFDSGTIAGAFALVNVLNTLKESKMFDVVNLDAYEITLKGE